MYVYKNYNINMQQYSDRHTSHGATTTNSYLYVKVCLHVHLSILVLDVFWAGFADNSARGPC